MSDQAVVLNCLDRAGRRKIAARRGAVVAFVALMLVAIFAVIALCVDIGWTTLTKSQLQTAADASAAAGASKLTDNYSSYYLTAVADQYHAIQTASSTAAEFAKRYGSYNGAGGTKSLTIRDADIELGFTTADGTYTASYSGYPNTVKVTARRDGAANTPLNLFFGYATGINTLDLAASAKAIAYGGLITSFNPNGGGIGPSGNNSNGWGHNYASSGGQSCTLLPFAFDVNHWNAFMATGVSPDGQKNLTLDGMPQIKIYPSPHNSPGNFGLLCIGPPTNSEPSYADWIRHGPTSSDLQYLLDHEMLPVSQQDPRDWKGSPGLKNSLNTDCAAIIGQPRLLPLFEPKSKAPYQAASGNGSNTTYRIVGFVGVKISQVTGNGNNLKVSIQPCLVIDPTAVYDPATIYPLGAEPVSQIKALTGVSSKFAR
jgi:Flp pilus assembly protein TadG